MCGEWGSQRDSKPGTPPRVRLDISGELAGRVE